MKLFKSKAEREELKRKKLHDRCVELSKEYKWCFNKPLLTKQGLVLIFKGFDIVDNKIVTQLATLDSDENKCIKISVDFVLATEGLRKMNDRWEEVKDQINNFIQFDKLGLRYTRDLPTFANKQL
jgi:hypothetical protein